MWACFRKFFSGPEVSGGITGQDAEGTSLPRKLFGSFMDYWSQIETVPSCNVQPEYFLLAEASLSESRAE